MPEAAPGLHWIDGHLWRVWERGGRAYVGRIEPGPLGAGWHVYRPRLRKIGIPGGERLWHRMRHKDAAIKQLEVYGLELVDPGG